MCFAFRTGRTQIPEYGGAVGSARWTSVAFGNRLRHPEQIETEDFWQTEIDYLDANPVRKGLVARAEYWRFWSASYWLSGGKRERSRDSS
jgi:hypothetical protein